MIAPRYVRFGNLPRSGHSMDLPAVKRLAGVCCYEGRMDERRGFIIDDTDLNEKMGLPGLAGMAATDRRAYFIEGEEVGRGPDGEPLLRVERVWPVPRKVNITCVDTRLQEALWLWSKGPRDGSGEKRLAERLGDEDSGYVPEGYARIPGVATAITRHGDRGGGPVDKEKRRRQRKARKKQRAKKR